MKPFGQFLLIKSCIFTRTKDFIYIYHLIISVIETLILFKNKIKNSSITIAVVHQFYIMRPELNTRVNHHAELKPIRRNTTDAVRELPDVNRWSYKQYTGLAYKPALGSNAAQLRKGRSADKKPTAINDLTVNEISAVAKIESHITALIEPGMDYFQIKSILMEHKMLGKIA